MPVTRPLLQSCQGRQKPPWSPKTHPCPQQTPHSSSHPPAPLSAAASSQAACLMVSFPHLIQPQRNSCNKTTQLPSDSNGEIFLFRFFFFFNSKQTKKKKNQRLFFSQQILKLVLWVGHGIPGAARERLAECAS